MHPRFEILLTALLVATATGCGRTSPAAVTRSLGSTEALALAAHLQIGMSEKRAARFLNEHGIPCYMSLGCSHGWTRFGELTNGCSLALDMEPTGFFGGGQLKAAYIQSNGINIAQVTLRGGR